MNRPRLLWQIYPPTLLIIITALVAISWYASNSLRQFYIKQTRADLTIRTKLVEDMIRHPFLDKEYDTLNTLCRQIGSESTTRITIILPSGDVVADSNEEPIKMDNHADRPEIIEALRNRPGFSMRFSKTLHKELLYVAQPIYADGPHSSASPVILGVLRLSIPSTSIAKALEEVYKKIGSSALVLIVIAALFTLTISRKISRPLEKIRAAAERIASGHLEDALTVDQDSSTSLEVASLAAAVKAMAAQLNDRLTTVTKQHNELNAVFSSMIEAVLVIDTEEKFISSNKAAVSLLDLPPSELEGKDVIAVIRNADLLAFIRETIASTGPLETDLTLPNDNREVSLNAHGTPLTDSNGNKVGGLIVLNDVTKLHRLENIRREFVANVSHELKTPITAIKGFIETLRDGAIDNREDSLRFIEIILKHADRLNAIVEDLLTLSRIEQEDEQGEIETKTGPLHTVLQNAIEACAIKAQGKNITIQHTCPDISAPMNAILLEQAVTNLLVNAIKYSAPETAVSLTADKQGDSIRIAVQDNGVGISKEHLPRLFERFYRSDKARSRKLGGTGLGLSIVKHIAQAHNGSVSVESTVGKGSVFTITIPAH